MAFKILFRALRQGHCQKFTLRRSYPFSSITFSLSFFLSLAFAAKGERKGNRREI